MPELSQLKKYGIVVASVIAALIVLNHTPSGILIPILLVAAYWAPTIVACSRHVTNQGSIIVINLFLGWTCIGWVVAMAMAVVDVRPPPPPRDLHFTVERRY